MHFFQYYSNLLWKKTWHFSFQLSYFNPLGLIFTEIRQEGVGILVSIQCCPTLSTGCHGFDLILNHTSGAGCHGFSPRSSLKFRKLWVDSSLSHTLSARCHGFNTCLIPELFLLFPILHQLLTSYISPFGY